MPQDSNSASTQQQDPLANAKLNKYRAVEGPTNRQLRLGLWWVEHHVLLRRLLVGILVAINGALWTPAVYQWAQYAYDGYFADRALARAAVVHDPVRHAAIAMRGARPIDVGSTTVIPASSGTYEVASAVHNANAHWYASFEYAFVRNGDAETAVFQPGYLLPGQETYLVDFVTEAGANVRPQLRNIAWQRIAARDSAELADIGSLAVRDVIVTLDRDGVVPLHRVSFTADNGTPYNFWEAEFTLEARSGGRLVGINKYIATQLRAGETRDITVVWPGNWHGARVTVTASADMFNDHNIQPFNLGPGQIK